MGLFWLKTVTVLRRVPWIVYAVVGVMAASAGLLHLHRKEVAASYVAGQEQKAAELNAVAHQLTDSLNGARVELRDAVAHVEQRSDSTRTRANGHVAAGLKATERLEASIRAVHESAPAVVQQDTAVVALVAASHVVALQNDTLRHDVVELSDAITQERAATHQLMVADSASLRGLGLVTAGVRDSLHVAQASRCGIGCKLQFAAIGSAVAGIAITLVRHTVHK